MHDSAMKEVQAFATAHVPSKPRLRIADIGSMDVNGTMRPVFTGHDYIGFDIAPGKAVDVVLTNPEVIRAEDASFDLVLSANCLEHTRRPWVVVRDMARILRPNGLMFILMPAFHTYHAHPIDCWRCYAEGMRGLLEDASLNVLSVYDTDQHDTVGIGRKAA